MRRNLSSLGLIELSKKRWRPRREVEDPESPLFASSVVVDTIQPWYVPAFCGCKEEKLLSVVLVSCRLLHLGSQPLFIVRRVTELLHV